MVNRGPNGTDYKITNMFNELLDKSEQVTMEQIVNF